MFQQQRNIGYLIIAVFLLVWCWLAFNLPPFMDEPELIAYTKAMSLTGQLKGWNFDLAQLFDVPLSYIRGKYIPYTLSWVYQIKGGDPVFLTRLLPLFFSLLTYGIVLFYFNFRKLLTSSRFVIWTILFLGSAIVLDNAYYLRFYASLATFMTVVFILYWEGLEAFRTRKILTSFVCWAVAFVLFAITVLDQWQYQQIPIMALAIGLSLFNGSPWYFSTIRWIKANGLWILLVVLLMGPIFTMAVNVIPIPFNNVNICHWFITYWDNIIGFLRVVLAINIGLMAIGFAFTLEKPLTFDRWLFVCGVLGVLLSTLYNPSNQVFFSRYSYFPVVMILIGLAGIFHETFVADQLRQRLLAIYLGANILIMMGNVYCEHSNIRLPIGWLKANVKQNDFVMAFDPLFVLNRGEELRTKAYLINASENVADVKALREQIQRVPPGGRIFYLYNDGYAFRDWLYQKTTGVDRYPGSDLFKYLSKRIASTDVLPGLRQCGLKEYSKEELIAGLDKLAVNGFDAPFKAPEKLMIKDALKAVGLVK